MKVNITIPTKLRECTLGQYQKYQEIQKNNEGAVDFLNLSIVNIFCKIKIKDIKDINVDDFDSILSTLQNTFNEKPRFVNRFTIRGVEYGFIPDIERCKMGEYIDMSKNIEDISTVHKLMAVMYRPITKKKGDQYLIEKYKGTSRYCDIMKEAPLDIALAAQVFFYNLGKELLKDTLVSLQLENPQMKTLKKLLNPDGDGITAFTPLLTGNLLNLERSLN